MPAACGDSLITQTDLYCRQHASSKIEGQMLLLLRTRMREYVAFSVLSLLVQIATSSTGPSCLVLVHRIQVEQVLEGTSRRSSSPLHTSSPHFQLLPLSLLVSPPWQSH